MFKKKIYSPVVVAQDLTRVMLEKRVIPVPNYSEKKEREMIVSPRGTIYGHNVKKKKSLKW